MTDNTRSWEFRSTLLCHSLLLDMQDATLQIADFDIQSLSKQ